VLCKTSHEKEESQWTNIKLTICLVTAVYLLWFNLVAAYSLLLPPLQWDGEENRQKSKTRGLR